MAGGNGSATAERPAAGLHSLDLNEHANGVPTREPYRMRFVIEGVCPIIFHRYDCESVETKGKAARGSETKKSDDTDSYYYRDEEKRVCGPATGLHGALISSGRWEQDPRSTRKTAMDLVKAGLIVEPDLIPFTRDGKFILTADFMDRRRVQVNRSAVARVRPALMKGWQAEFDVQVLEPELLTPQLLRVLMERAGRLVGWCDFRPQHGRFQIVSATVSEF